MKQKSKRTLTPKLRFPEFRDGGNWNAQRLGSFTTVMKGKGISKADLVPYGKQPCIRYGELYTYYGEVIEKVVAHTNANADDLVLSRKQDVIIPSSGETKIDIAKASCVMLDDVALGSDLNILRSHLYGPFFSYYLNGSKRFDIAKVAQGDTVAHLYPSQLEKVEITYPSLPEQQKIAECLGSLDGLIAAEGRKLATLRDHKRGLMQQLFPQPGQTQPRLRFPKFRDKGEWDVRPLSDICERIMDGTHFSPKTKDGPRPYLTSKNIRNGAMDLSTVTFISEEEHRDIYKRCPVRVHDVLLTKDGASTGNCTINTLDYEFSLLSSVAVIRGNSELLDQQFLYQTIASDRTQQLIAGSMSGQAITRITLTKLGEYLIAYPSIEEQQRIAACLAALDTQIAAQAAKIEALKQHKRGLMQQLFPAPEEQ